MRVVPGALGACLLLTLVAPACAQALQPAIREVAIDNRGKDEVVVVLSRASATQPFLYSNRLKPGGRDVVAVPDLPTLLVDVLRRGDVKRAQLAEQGGPPEHADDGGKRKRQALVLGLALAVAKKRDDHDDDRDDKHHDERERDEREEEQQQQQQEEGGHEVHSRDEGYGRPDDDSGKDVNAGTQHVLLTNMLGTQPGAYGSEPLPQPPLTQERRTTLDAGSGDGTRVVNGVGLAVNTEPASAPPPEPTPPPASTPATTSSDTCYCGPDASAAYLEALRRAFGRIQKLDNDQKGAWDGTWFLSRNAGSLDERVRPARAPGANAGNESGDVICPSGPCANLPGAGGGTIRLFGHCLPQHVGNDIMYGFVATLLDVPTSIQRAGGHWAQLNSTYSSLDPPQSQAAYEIGRQLAEMEDDDTRGPFYDLAGATAAFDGAAYWTGTGLAEIPKRNNAVGFILGVYPALANCASCPADANQTATLLRDWTNSVWDLGKGKKAYPPSYSDGE